MKRYLIFAIFFLMGMVTFAQITNVCGNDTVILQVDNYVDGVIEWQESIDNNSWATIPEVSGALYKFMPKENKYYRAVVKTSTCDPLYSAVSFVQLPPIANAGTDRIIGDTNMTLLANIDANVSGIWSIIEGNNGTLSDKTFANSNFSGIYNQQYKLLWTVTNACGQAKDTVMIEFKEIKAKNNFIIVDNTDSIYSDSTDLSWGVYKIKFSDSTIVASDSIILIGVRSDMSFLRKVYGFNKSISKNIYSFYTEQATFEDIITSGTVNIGDAVNQSITQGTLKSYSPFPTRNTIKNNSDNKGLLMLYASSTNDNSESNSLKSGQEGLTMKLPDVTIFKDKKETIKLSIEDASVTLEPHIVCDVEVLM